MLPSILHEKEDGDIAGALDVQEAPMENVEGLEPEGEQVDVHGLNMPKRIICAMDSKYPQEGVKKLCTATDIAKAGFTFAFAELLKMAAEGNQIIINASVETPLTMGRRAVYRYLILDLIKGGKFISLVARVISCKLITKSPCIPLIQKRPYNLKRMQKGASRKLLYTYKRQDDFTPSYDDLSASDGVDPVSAKWIYVQLNAKEEREHLFHLLMAPVIPNDNEGLLETLDFMNDRQNPRVQLIEKAYELITDLGTALEIKFGDNLFFDCWTEQATLDIDPFLKEEDVELDLSKIDDPDMVKMNSSEPVAWELDRQVLAILKPGQFYAAEQPGFFDLIEAAQKKYQLVAAHLSRDLLAHPEEQGTEFKRLEFEQVNKQYYVSHQMIGGDDWGENGGQHCLFSNLLAVILTNREHLTKKNVDQLRKAMAAYLDKLQEAKKEWEKIEASPEQLEGAEKLKELAELAEHFEDGIRHTYGCDILPYQVWLRDLPYIYAGGQYVSAAGVNIEDLTPLEIQLAAYTVGVKIGLLPIALDLKSAVDEHGRIMPVGQYYGPNTNEVLLMAVSSKTKSYYGLHPRLKLHNNVAVNSIVTENDLRNIKLVESYWKAIDM